ncbi:MAG TPA: ROK family protein [Chloroflexota bacterium]|nr:ROK family protein [Chloroflexota bacterium]
MADPRTLCIDVGGTGLKIEVVGVDAQPLTERARVVTPHPATPEAVLKALKTLIKGQGEFDRVSVGFPGVVVDGVVKTAPNLDPSWHGYDLAKALQKMTGKPVRVCNDADVQGYGDIEGKGVEMVLTLGTGLGSAVYIDGRLLPNLELGHAPFKNGKTYEEFVSDATLKKIGHKKWRKRVTELVEKLEPIWNWRVLYLGGGNARLLKEEELPANVRIASNAAGLTGGVALWRDRP